MTVLNKHTDDNIIVLPKKKLEPTRECKYTFTQQTSFIQRRAAAADYATWEIHARVSVAGAIYYFAEQSRGGSLPCHASPARGFPFCSQQYV
jgi:hypothetical protein